MLKNRDNAAIDLKAAVVWRVKRVLKLGRRLKKAITWRMRRLTKKPRRFIQNHPAIYKPAKKFEDWLKYLKGGEDRWCYLPQEIFEKKTDKTFLSRVQAYVDAVEESNGCRYYEPYGVRIGIIADEFLFDSYKNAAQFVPLTMENWEEKVNEIDLMLFVSAWRGLHGEWIGLSHEETPQRKTAFRILESCKKQNIPVIFYSKEDPPNYDVFLPYAKECDYIFTSCEEVIDKYKKDCPNARDIRSLAFGINPVFHNPIGLINEHKQDEVIFSGSWMRKYPERQKQQSLLLDGVLLSGKKVRIVDRNYDRTPASSYRYPPAYWSKLSPAVPHDVLQKLHKLYDWALDINTVMNSKTMFANRGYELQAAGNVQIANYALGVQLKLPYVYIAKDKEAVANILEKTSQEDVMIRQMDGIRAMMTGETCFDRVGEILDMARMPMEQKKRRIAVIADSMSDHIKTMFERQTYEDKTLMDAASVTWEDLEGFDMVAFWTDTAEYDLYYLEDMSNGFKYTSCDFITKDAFMKEGKLQSGVQHAYTNSMKDKNRTLFWKEAFDASLLKNSEQSCKGRKGYSIDALQYEASAVYAKQQEEEIQKKKASCSYQTCVVIPVGSNEADHAYAKAFAAEKRQDTFEKTKILFADYSCNERGKKLLSHLERQYANVEVISGQTKEEAMERANEKAAASKVRIVEPMEAF